MKYFGRITKTLLLLIVPNIMMAYDFSVDGIYYNLVESNGSMVAEVTSASQDYAGTVVIPSTVNYNGTSYPVTTIGDAAFYDCEKLLSVTIPNSVSVIGVDAFAYCTGLTTITLPNSLTTIMYDAFYESGLTSVHIPSSVTSIDGNVFRGCVSLNTVSVAAGNTYYDSRNNCNAIVDTESDWIVTGTNNTVIPDDVYGIGMSAFAYCTGITALHFHSRMKTVGQSAFYGCSNLKTLYIPQKLITIEAGAFGGCGALMSITVEDGNKKYDSRNSCNAIIETETNTLLFGCKNTSIPSDVKIIAAGAFSECGGLNDVTLPEGLTTIKSSAFLNCSGLTTISFPSTLTNIESSAFEGCTGLTSVSIPASVTKIGNFPFKGCTALTSIIVDENNTKYDSRDQSNTIIQTSTNKLLQGCATSSIPSGVTELVNSCFAGMGNLTSIAIPSTVTKMGSSCFEKCDRLTIVSVDIAVPLKINRSFFTNRSNATLYVPVGCRAAYAAADFWKEFRTIKEGSAIFVPGDANGDGVVTEEDYHAVSLYIKGQAPDNFDERAADVNKDGVINVADYVGIAHIILYGTIEHE